MRRVAFLPLLVCAAIVPAELPHPSERLALLPGDDWIPRAGASFLYTASERPHPELAVSVHELGGRAAVGTRLALLGDATLLRAGELRQWQVAGGIELRNLGMASGLRVQRESWRIGDRVATPTLRWELRHALTDDWWCLALRHRQRGARSLQDLAFQLRRGPLRCGIGREASPFGGAAGWSWGAGLALSRALSVGVTLRAESADLQLLARRRSLRLHMAISASGPLQGGFAWLVGWSP